MPVVTESFVIAPKQAVRTLRPIADRITRMLEDGATLTAFELDDDEENVVVTFDVP
jgi:hypothetical protein